MPKKVNYPAPWIPPTVDELKTVVMQLGGKADTARLLGKNHNTITRWCRGETQRGIDRANWEYMCNATERL